MDRLSFDHNRVIVGASDPNVTATATKNNNNNLRFGQQQQTTTSANVPALAPPTATTTTTNQAATVGNLMLSTDSAATITGSIQVKRLLK